MTPSDKEELRTLIEKAAKLMGYTFQFRRGVPCIYKQPKTTNTNLSALGWEGWNPYTSAHDNAILRIRLGIEVDHTEGLAEAWNLGTNSSYSYVDYSENPTDRDKLQAEFLAVLRCAGAIYDERNPS